MYQDIFSLKERVIIVTGGAGHLGRDVCKGLASFGGRVIAVGRTETRFPELLSFNTADLSGSIECVRCDVRDEQAFADVVETVWRKCGRIDALINNAADTRREKWDEVDKKAWLEGLDGLLNHYFSCTRAVSTYMLRVGKGTVVNNGSIWSFLAPVPKMYLDLNNQPPVYVTAAKGAIVQMTRHLAAEWGPKGVRVNAFSPGWFPQKRGPERPDYISEITSRVPMNRIGTPPDIVGVVIFLVSDASAYMTGQNLVVDGGYSIW